jgi:hypothetical protein
MKISTLDPGRTFWFMPT